MKELHQIVPALQRWPDERFDGTLESDPDYFRFRSDGTTNDVIVRTGQHCGVAVQRRNPESGSNRKFNLS